MEKLQKELDKRKVFFNGNINSKPNKDIMKQIQESIPIARKYLGNPATTKNSSGIKLSPFRKRI